MTRQEFYFFYFFFSTLAHLAFSQNSLKELLQCLTLSFPSRLYRSRAGPSDSVTPLQWCRQVLDRPRLEVKPTRRSMEQGMTLPPVSVYTLIEQPEHLLLICWPKQRVPHQPMGVEVQIRIFQINLYMIINLNSILVDGVLDFPQKMCHSQVASIIFCSFLAQYQKVWKLNSL